LAALVKNKIEEKSFFNENLKNLFVLASCFLFLFGVVSLLYTTNHVEGLKNIKGKSVLLAIPIALCGCDYINEVTRQKILKWYCLLLFIACAYTIYAQFKAYSATHDSSVFFYHSLISSYSGHAIQFSILVFVALVHLFENSNKSLFLFNRLFHLFLILFFSVFLFFLSSKLVIIFYLFYFVYFMIRTLRLRAINKPVFIGSAAAFVALCIFVFATNNTISRRFNDVAQTDFRFLQREKFSPGLYFNGLEFRLLQWKFVPQILNEKKAWFLGLGAGDAQAYLDQKYISENMYTGSTQNPSKGFLGYNTHNEFLEALLQTGVVGLSLFLMLCLAMIKNAWQRKTVELSFITMLLLAYTFTESVLESQYSSFIFLFFPLFFYVKTNRTSA
ncbi:MAG TPA: O-antigen ligase family protein, partial [Chitinophagaceae bacterium]|nr:O-antigen ligase family protein [Chitinophagaceae bacterium]